MKARLRKLLAGDVRGLLGSSAIAFACRVGGAGSVFITQLLLARWLGIEQLGAYALAFAWFILLSTVAGLGFPSGFFRFVSVALERGDAATVRGYYRRGAQVGVLTGMVIALLGAAAFEVLATPEQAQWRALWWVALAQVPLFAFNRNDCSLAHTMQHLTLAVAPAVLGRPLLLLGVLVVVALAGVDGLPSALRLFTDADVVGTVSVLGVPLDAAAVMTLHGAVVAVVTLGVHLGVRRVLERDVASAPATGQVRVWLPVVVPLLGTTLVLRHFQELGVIAVGLTASAEEVAVFNVALRIAFLLGFGISAVEAASMPKIARLHARGERRELQAFLGRAAALRCGVAIAGLVVLVVAGKPLVGLFGPGFEQAYRPMLLLAGAQVTTALLGPSMQLLNISGFQKLGLVVSTITVAALFVAQAVLVPLAGTTGAALGVLLAMTAQALWMFGAARRRLAVDTSLVACFARTAR